MTIVVIVVCAIGASIVSALLGASEGFRRGWYAAEEDARMKAVKKQLYMEQRRVGRATSSNPPRLTRIK